MDTASVEKKKEANQLMKKKIKYIDGNITTAAGKALRQSVLFAKLT